MRLQRWAITLAAFNYSIRFVLSSQNAVADGLSRLPLPSTVDNEEAIYNVEERLIHSLPITHKEITHAIRVDPIQSQVLGYVKQGWPQRVDDQRLQPYFNRRFELSVEQDCLLWRLRVIIPFRYQKDILEELHLGHPGIVRMKELGHSYVWWPNMDQEVGQTVRNCNSCQQVKKPPAPAPLTPWLWPSNPWHRIHVDYAQDKMGHYFILVDAHSRWPEIYFMRENTSATATIAILQELLAKYGLQYIVLVTMGPSFAVKSSLTFES